jgi:hypothetical protein
MEEKAMQALMPATAALHSAPYILRQVELHSSMTRTNASQPNAQPKPSQRSRWRPTCAPGWIPSFPPLAQTVISSAVFQMIAKAAYFQYHDFSKPFSSPQFYTGERVIRSGDLGAYRWRNANDHDEGKV